MAGTAQHAQHNWHSTQHAHKTRPAAAFELDSRALFALCIARTRAAQRTLANSALQMPILPPKGSEPANKPRGPSHLRRHIRTIPAAACFMSAEGSVSPWDGMLGFKGVVDVARSKPEHQAPTSMVSVLWDMQWWPLSICSAPKLYLQRWATLICSGGQLDMRRWPT